MGAIQIKKPLLGDLLGIAGMDCAGGDETVLSTVNVRFDAMFRESILHRDMIALMPASELTKLANFTSHWYESAKTLKIEPVRFKPKEVGLPDTVLTSVNSWPDALATRCEGFGGLVLAQSPEISYRQSRGLVTLQAWMRVVLVPTLDDKGR